VLSLGEDADFLIIEAATFQRPSEAYQTLFRREGAATVGGSVRGEVRQEAQ